MDEDFIKTLKKQIVSSPHAVHINKQIFSTRKYDETTHAEDVYLSGFPDELDSSIQRLYSGDLSDLLLKVNKTCQPVQNILINRSVLTAFQHPQTGSIIRKKGDFDVRKTLCAMLLDTTKDPRFV
jgi:hypothetical protein